MFIVGSALFIKANGPAVWLVAVRACPERSEGSRWRGFCAVPVDGRVVSRPGRSVQMAESR